MAFSTEHNYFELFDLKPSFAIDLDALHEQQIKLQGDYHPDRAVAGSDQEKRIAVQKAAWVNEAYATLKNPVKRAHYLLELQGIEKDDNQTTADASFLMEQISYREAMDECRTNTDPLDCIDHVRDKLKSRFADFSAEFNEQYEAADYQAAQESARKMMFVQKILDQLADLQSEIEDEMM